MEAIKQELDEFLCRDDLLQSALVVGKLETPGLDIEPYLGTIMTTAARIWKKLPKKRKDPILIAEKINEAMFDYLGLVGKNSKYKRIIDNPDQYFLHRLLDTKKGAPVTFAVFYMILAEQVGLDVECLSFPSHYYLKVADGGIGHFYIDPFDGGKIITDAEFQRKFRASMQRNRLLSTNLFESVGPLQITARLIQQLKHVYVLKNDALKALRAIEMLTVIFPESAELTRDRGVLYCEMEYFSKAVEDLRSYLKRCPQAEDVKEIKKLTLMLRGYRETMN